MSAYRFLRLTSSGVVIDEQIRDLSDDDAAVAWMGVEFLNAGEHLEAFPEGRPSPFDSRHFGEDVEVSE